jgi:ribosomal protein S18 acetylase RimI-like enzyme
MQSRAVGEVKLRPIDEADFPFLRQVYASTRAEEMALLNRDDKEKEDFLRLQFDAQHQFYQAQFPNAAFDIIEMDGRPLGRLYVDRRENEIRLIDIAILPQYQRQRIGGTLVRSLLQEATESARRVSIHVAKLNPALRLYERLGFVDVQDDGVYRLMVWSPPPDRRPAQP